MLPADGKIVKPLLFAPFCRNGGNGLRPEVAELADTHIQMPIAGQLEPIRAAIAATVLMP